MVLGRVELCREGGGDGQPGITSANDDDVCFGGHFWALDDDMDDVLTSELIDNFHLNRDIQR